ncbi:PucR-like helix-turn-helix protein [Kribbella amoyensis]|uniref:PucR-like helix-turn-helix protein n=1 Tax=Kribbella amoyensis TaxID=996641 RepID=A0A561BUY5_9ACTN|nr:PucR family transcriptional regulator ligand-binding domain-containing protein [Kribbella amoyensis]TWD82679.1 PucR-like helix-turn-helix protein [Kribbella amoyensis]
MLTLQTLLQDPALELRPLVPGPPGSLDQPALWLHNTELPDPSRYVRAGEIVLTNGLWLHETTAESFVGHLLTAGAAGLIFGLRKETPRTPDDLISACERAGLPLVEISIKVPFSAVTEAAADIYTEQRQDALVGLVRRGNALASAISHGAGATGVLSVLRREHRLPLVVVDRMGRSLAAADAELTPEQLRTVAGALARRPPPLELDLGDGTTATIFLVSAVSDIDAALLCLRPVAGLSRAEQDALEQTARFLSLEVAKQQAVHAIEQRYASELLDMILSGAQRAAEVPDRLRSFGVDPSAPLAVCALAFAAGEPLPGIADTVTDFFLGHGIAAVVAAGSQDVVAVLPWRRAAAELAVLAAELCDAVRRRFPDQRPVAGLGELASSAAELRRPLVQAREACRLLRRRSDQSVAAFAELGTHRLLLGLQDQETLGGFADTVLTPLREYDRKHAGELERTLRVFLANDGQFGTTATQLYVHVNTLRNRLTKIAELSGRDVTRTEDRVELFLALEADAMR